MNLTDWYAVNRKTGEEMELDMLIVKDGGSFNKTYIKEMAKMIGCAGEKPSLVLRFLLENKNNKNQVLGTHRSIAKDINVNTSTVTKVFSALTKEGFVKKVRSGLYIFNPDVLYYGGTGNKIAILKVWRDLK